LPRVVAPFLYLAEWLRRQRRRQIEEMKKKGANIARRMKRLTSRVRKERKERYSEEKKEIVKERQHAKKR